MQNSKKIFFYFFLMATFFYSQHPSYSMMKGDEETQKTEQSGRTAKLAEEVTVGQKVLPSAPEEMKTASALAIPPVGTFQLRNLGSHLNLSYNPQWQDGDTRAVKGLYPHPLDKAQWWILNGSYDTLLRTLQSADDVRTPHMLDSNSKGEVYTWHKDNSKEEEWILTPDSKHSGYFRCQNYATKLFLDSDGYGNISAKKENGSDYQLWWILQSS